MWRPRTATERGDAAGPELSPVSRRTRRGWPRARIVAGCGRGSARRPRRWCAATRPGRGRRARRGGTPARPRLAAERPPARASRGPVGAVAHRHQRVGISVNSCHVVSYAQPYRMQLVQRSATSSTASAGTRVPAGRGAASTAGVDHVVALRASTSGPGPSRGGRPPAQGHHGQGLREPYGYLVASTSRRRSVHVRLICGSDAAARYSVADGPLVASERRASGPASS